MNGVSRRVTEHPIPDVRCVFACSGTTQRTIGEPGRPGGPHVGAGAAIGNPIAGGQSPDIAGGTHPRGWRGHRWTGSAPVQIAKALGASVVGLASARSAAVVRAAGADAVLDGNQTPLERVGGRFDVVYDVAARSSVLRARHLLSEDGIFVANVADPLHGMARVLAPWLRRCGVRKRGSYVWVRPSGEDLAVLCRLVDEGRVATGAGAHLPVGTGARSSRSQRVGPRAGQDRVAHRVTSPRAGTINHVAKAATGGCHTAVEMGARKS